MRARARDWRTHLISCSWTSLTRSVVSRIDTACARACAREGVPGVCQRVSGLRFDPDEGSECSGLLRADARLRARLSVCLRVLMHARARLWVCSDVRVVRRVTMCVSE